MKPEEWISETYKLLADLELQLKLKKDTIESLKRKALNLETRIEATKALLEEYRKLKKEK